jgi:hypothetical protein
VLRLSREKKLAGLGQAREKLKSAIGTVLAEGGQTEENKGGGGGGGDSLDGDDRNGTRAEGFHSMEMRTVMTVTGGNRKVDMAVVVVMTVG